MQTRHLCFTAFESIAINARQARFAISSGSATSIFLVQLRPLTSDQIGRGAADRWVDLKLQAKKDVSRGAPTDPTDPATGQFFIKTSALSTVNAGVCLHLSISQVIGVGVGPEYRGGASGQNRKSGWRRYGDRLQGSETEMTGLHAARWVFIVLLLVFAVVAAVIARKKN